LHELLLLYPTLLCKPLQRLAALLFDASATPKYLAVQSDFISVLHTWGQNLTLHPHVHVVVPAGGLTVDGKFRVDRITIP